MGKTFEKHLADVKSGLVTKTNVIGLRKALNQTARSDAGWSVSRTVTILTSEQCGALFDALAEHKPIVTGELHASGLAQLTNKRYRKQLEAYADVTSDIQRFRLIGFEPIGNRGEYYVPVYQAENSAGRRLPFINIPWQSGGHGPEIVYNH
jgi:hypothetical protein